MDVIKYWLDFELVAQFFNLKSCLWFWNHMYDFRQNYSPLSSITIINHDSRLFHCFSPYMLKYNSHQFIVFIYLAQLQSCLSMKEEIGSFIYIISERNLKPARWETFFHELYILINLNWKRIHFLFQVSLCFVVGSDKRAACWNSRNVWICFVCER